MDQLRQAVLAMEKSSTIQNAPVADRIPDFTFASMVKIEGMTKEQYEMETAILRMPTTLDDANDPFAFLNRRAV